MSVAVAKFTDDNTSSHSHLQLHDNFVSAADLSSAPLCAHRTRDLEVLQALKEHTVLAGLPMPACMSVSITSKFKSRVCVAALFTPR